VITEHKAAKEAIQTLNADLERRVAVIPAHERGDDTLAADVDVTQRPHGVG